MEITFVYPYYENGTMFRFQQEVWNRYPSDLKKQLHIIVVDDCSKHNPAAKFIAPNIGVDLQLYRIEKKVAWNWLEARNIGVHYANTEWLLLTDMDHVVRMKIFQRLMRRLPDLDPTKVYQFSRVRAPRMDHYKFHNDSFLVTKELFWKCGGYDEDYAGQYGTSGMFRRRLFSAASGHVLFTDMSLILYPREVIADASTTNLPRKHGRDPNGIRRITEEKKQSGRLAPRHFLQPYSRVL